ncbi:MAG: cobalamin-dependent protein [Deltaproteobacteria bacterium]|nr:cobalamin-dependent protein [Deltaproteobacteria bacterium]
MHILFVNHISNGPAFSSGIAALSAFVKRHGNAVSLLNVTPDIKDNQIRDAVKKASPDLIGLGVHTPHWEWAKEHIAIIKKASDAPIICGGYHPTLCPEDVIAMPAVDILCRGEGEGPLLQLISRLEQKRPYHDIKGLWVKRRSLFGTKVLRNPVAAPVALDDLPYWDRDLFFDSGLSAADLSLTHIGGFPLASGRGCPYNCAFCNNASLLKMYRQDGDGAAQYVRKRSVQNVIEECRFLIDMYNPSSLEFWDEMFASDRDWTARFCEAYEREISLPFITALRVERADPATLHALHDAGCRCIFFGVEVGNEQYRKRRLNRHMSNSQIKDAFATAKRLGLERFAWVMLGLPDETPEMIQETIDFLIEIKPDIIGWSVYHPLPETELYRYCKEKGYLSDSPIFPYKGAPHYPVPALRQPSLPLETVEMFCDEFRGLKELGFQVNQ